MSKRDREFEWRMEGLDMAYRIACQTEGKDSPTARAIANELRFRIKSGVSLRVTKKELEKASTDIKMFTIQTVLAMSMIVLWDEFHFGARKRLRQFKEEFDRYATALVNDEISWLDILDSLEATTGIQLVLPEELKKGGDYYS